MRHITNTQIEELNKLLPDHADALKALFKEGMSHGARGTVMGSIFGISLAFGVSLIWQIKKIDKEEGP